MEGGGEMGKNVYEGEFEAWRGGKIEKGEGEGGERLNG